MKTAIVTGAGSGLGRAIAVRLARDGFRLALADIDAAGNEATLDLVREAGGSGDTEILDVADAAAWQSLRERLEQRWQHLDLLVNNAGVGASGEVGSMPLADWQWTINTNLMGTVYGCHEMVPWLKRNPGGASIVNIASLAGVLSAPSMGAYSVSKAGMIALSETLYAELRGQKIAVVCVCPGFFATEIVARGRFDTEHQRQSALRYMRRSRISSEGVADRIVRAIRRKQLYVFAPARAWLLWRLKRAMPSALLRLVGAGYRRRKAQLAAANAPPAAEATAATDAPRSTTAEIRR